MVGEVNIMLSKENQDKLVPTGLYEHDPIDDRFTATSGNYHCKNWTFKISGPHKDGSFWALDTYFHSWDSHKMEVTDLNFNKFKLVVDMDTIEEIMKSSFFRRSDDSRFCRSLILVGEVTLNTSLLRAGKNLKNCTGKKLSIRSNQPKKHWNGLKQAYSIR